MQVARIAAAHPSLSQRTCSQGEDAAPSPVGVGVVAKAMVLSYR